MALGLQSIGACPSSRVIAYSRCSPTCVVVAALLIVTPGPDTALVTRHALLAGRRAASFTTLGIGTGSIIWALASVLGIAVLLEESVVA